MKPTVKIASARTPGGEEIALYRHDTDWLIKINGVQLMHSRQHESELELARLGCAHLSGRKAPRILIGGLGMGFTLRETLNIVSPQSEVVVSELLAAVVTWNRELLGELNGNALNDPRVIVRRGDAVELISRAERRFDAILLDIDNGPGAVTVPGNARMYGDGGIRACYRALRDRGCLAVWSAAASKDFERLLMACGFHVRRYRAPAYKGSKSQTRFVWVAAADRTILPEGGGEPLQSQAAAAYWAERSSVHRGRTTTRR